MSMNILLISEAMIKERTAIHGNIDPKLIYPDIKLAQDMYIVPILGSALFLKLQMLITTGMEPDPDKPGYSRVKSLGDVNYQMLIDHYIVDPLMYYTLSELPTTISYQFWNKGVMRKQNDNTELPSMSELIDLANKYKNRAEFYANRLNLFLKQNAVEKFPEYLLPGNGFDTVYPGQETFTMPVYLGDDDYCCDAFKKPTQPYRE